HHPETTPGNNTRPPMNCGLLVRRKRFVVLFVTHRDIPCDPCAGQFGEDRLWKRGGRSWKSCRTNPLRHVRFTPIATESVRRNGLTRSAKGLNRSRGSLLRQAARPTR